MKLDNLRNYSIAHTNDILNWLDNPITKLFFADMSANHQLLLEKLSAIDFIQESSKAAQHQGRIKLSGEIVTAVLNFKAELESDDEETDGNFGDGGIFEGVPD